MKLVRGPTAEWTEGVHCNIALSSSSLREGGLSGDCRRGRGIQGGRSGRLGNGEGDGDEDRAKATVEEERTERRLGVELPGRARRVGV